MELVLSTFAVRQKDPVQDEEALTEILAERIAEMLDNEADLLFSTLYRLDVSEQKITGVLRSRMEEPARGLARLVLERQKEKLKTRRKYDQSDSGPE